MKLQFDREEYDSRIKRVCVAMDEESIDGIVLFKQESMYYLTGYDTAGYTMFQGMFLSRNGEAALLTRSADAYQAAYTSVIRDIRQWEDREGASPGDDLRDLLESYGCRGKNIGIEYHAYGLTGQRAKMVDGSLAGFCRVRDASDLVRLVRLVKTPAELDYVRKAGQLAENALAVARSNAKPGVQLGAVYGDMMAEVMRSGGDPPASRWPMGSGADALLVRYHTDLGVIAKNDQVTFEFGGTYRHYHACLMHTSLTGRVSGMHQRMYDGCRDALDACRSILRPGYTVGDIYDTHARVLTKAGFREYCLKACGYTLGIAYPPTWMDWPMFWSGNPQILEPGMVFFMHMILIDREDGRAMSLGETAIVTEDQSEPVCEAPRELIVN